MSKGSGGFSLLEVMMAALVLMVGMAAIAQLNRSLLTSMDPRQSSGLGPHPAIVENLLRDQVEQARIQDTVALPATVPALVTPQGTYSVQVALAAPPVVASLNEPTASPTSMGRVRYVATVYFQANGAPAPGDMAGLLIFDKVAGKTGRSGL